MILGSDIYLEEYQWLSMAWVGVQKRWLERGLFTVEEGGIECQRCDKDWR